MTNPETTTFPLADMPTGRETGGMSFNERYMSRLVASVKTGEFRAPKCGEWYLSGAVPEAYRAENDLSTRYHILKLVKVQRETIVKVTVLPLN